MSAAPQEVPMYSHKRQMGMALVLLLTVMLCSCATSSLPVDREHPAHSDAEAGMHTRSDTLSIREDERVEPPPEPMGHEMQGMGDM
jgi:hypothetical protein